jgi:hypothetical protein
MIVYKLEWVRSLVIINLNKSVDHACSTGNLDK